MKEYEIHKTPLPAMPKNKPISGYDFESMSIGDWFVVHGMEKADSAQNAGYYYGKKTGTGFRLSRRKDRTSEGSYFLVRVK